MVSTRQKKNVVSKILDNWDTMGCWRDGSNGQSVNTYVIHLLKKIALIDSKAVSVACTATTVRWWQVVERCPVRNQEYVCIADVKQ